MGTDPRIRRNASRETVALTMPAPSSVRLLWTLVPPPDAVAELLPIPDLVRPLPGLTDMARCPEGVPRPAWDASFPAASPVIHTILHDSSNRGGRPRLMLVIQARPRFSRERLDEPLERWRRDLLAEAVALRGDWAAEPDLVRSHVWRHARADSTSG